jgi:hypothetical protein
MSCLTWQRSLSPYKASLQQQPRQKCLIKQQAHSMLLLLLLGALPAPQHIRKQLNL